MLPTWQCAVQATRYCLALLQAIPPRREPHASSGSQSCNSRNQLEGAPVPSRVPNLQCVDTVPDRLYFVIPAPAGVPGYALNRTETCRKTRDLPTYAEWLHDRALSSYCIAPLPSDHSRCFEIQAIPPSYDYYVAVLSVPAESNSSFVPLILGSVRSCQRCLMPLGDK